MEPLSLRALIAIIQAIEYQRDHAIGRLDRNEPHLPGWEVDHVIEHIDDLEHALDEVEVLYNELRKNNTRLIPFTELLKNRRELHD
jgi:hypothetical protein